VTEELDQILDELKDSIKGVPLCGRHGHSDRHGYTVGPITPLYDCRARPASAFNRLRQRRRTDGGVGSC
jgi:hypothetical protein